MRRVPALLSTLTAVTLLAGAASAVTSDSTSSTGAAGTARATHRLSGELVPNLDTITDLGALPATTVFQISAHLSENTGAEAAAFAAMNDIHSPSYHHYLTVAQYVAEFGQPASVTQAVTRQLTLHGMTVINTNKPGSIVTLSGTAAQIEATFDTPLRSYKLSTGRVFRANTVAPSVPADVDALVGLQTLSEPQLAKTATVKPQQACLAGDAAGVCTGAIQPPDLWAAYDQPSGNRGAGQQIGIVGAGQVATVLSDLRGFEDVHKLRHVPVREELVGDGQTYSAGEGEWALDSAASTGMAPDIDRLTYYFADTLSDTDPALAAFADDTAAGAPMQANYSVGGCESVNYALGSITEEEPIFRQDAMEGKTQFVSTGDTGGSCTVAEGNGFANTGAPMVEWPSSSDAVIGVGGTELYTDGDPSTKRVLEKAWDYSGGGSSDFIPEPSWQAAIGIIDHPCVTDAIDSPPKTLATCRGLPDVTALSGDITVLAGTAGQTSTTMEAEEGYTDFEGATEDANGVVTPGSATVDGGTSLASPLWVGMWTRMQAAAGGKLGFAAPALYGIGENATKDADDFFDISIGQNFQNQALPRSAVDPTGWDYVSGLGVPDVSKLMTDLAGTTANPNPVVPANDTPDIETFTPPAASCPDPGHVSDPTGDTAAYTVSTSTADGDVDITAFDVTTPTTSALRFTTTMVNTANTTDTIDDETDFAYLGVSYVIDAVRNEPGDSETFTLVSVDDSGTLATDTTLGTLTGKWDDATNTYAVDLPFATFNMLAKPAVALALGNQLTALETDTNTSNDDEIDYDDSATTACPYYVGGAKGTATIAPGAARPPLTEVSMPKQTISCAVRTSTIKVYGKASTRLNKHGQATYTFKLFVNLGKCKTPSAIGRQIHVYVDGKKVATLRTGKGGLIVYRVRFKPGRHTLTASFVGNNDLKKSSSPKLRNNAV